MLLRGGVKEKINLPSAPQEGKIPQTDSTAV